MENPEHHIDSLFMQRALELAVKGRGHVSPNPLVGCVIVHEGKIIGEGWHQQYGEAHAEVNAVHEVENINLLNKCTIYVNLEPCSHYGKTPPCADLLIKHQVKKVVVANVDPNPLVGGNGIKKLRDAGIEVITGVCEADGRELNKRFFTFIQHQRPYIILKWAQTADGFIARENLDSKWISNVYARQLVHRWRTEEDAVLVGMKTAEYDNPQLNVRDWSGRNPVRIVIDRFLKLNTTIHLFDGSQKTLCYNVLKNEEHINLCHVEIGEQNFIGNLVKDLYNKNIQSVIIEGGAATLSAFVDAGLWDEARIFVADKTFGAGIKAPVIIGKMTSQQNIMEDILQIFNNSNQST